MDQLGRSSFDVVVVPDRTSSGADHVVLDLQNLTQSKKIWLVEQALQTQDQDNEKLYSRMRARFDRYSASTDPCKLRLLQASDYHTVPNIK